MPLASHHTISYMMPNRRTCIPREVTKKDNAMQLTGIHHLTAISAKPRQILALGPIVLTVSELSRTAFALTEVMNMRRVRDYAAHGAQIHVFAMGEGGPAAELHVLEQKDGPAQQGAGGVHHVAFRTPDE